MKVHLDCIPCFLRQAIFASGDAPEALKEEMLRDVMRLLLELDWGLSPDELANRVHALVRKKLGNPDPYYEVKKRSNKLALRLYPWLKKEVEKGKTPEERLFLSAKLALAGNIIDFGPATEFDVEKTVKEVLAKNPAINHFELLREKVAQADRLLYFADNAGEVLFDRIFIEEMLSYRGKPFDEINFVVKGGPILNDAMLEDALEVGLDSIPNITFSKLGNGEPGTGPARRSPEVKKFIESYPLVISKGQGNFEGFSEYTGLFFMFIVKCKVVAGRIGVSVYETVIKYQ